MQPALREKRRTQLPAKFRPSEVPPASASPSKPPSLLSPSPAQQRQQRAASQKAAQSAAVGLHRMAAGLPRGKRQSRNLGKEAASIPNGSIDAPAAHAAGVSQTAEPWVVQDTGVPPARPYRRAAALSPVSRATVQEQDPQEAAEPAATAASWGGAASSEAAVATLPRVRRDRKGRIRPSQLCAAVTNLPERPGPTSKAAAAALACAAALPSLKVPTSANTEAVPTRDAAPPAETLMPAPAAAGATGCAALRPPEPPRQLQSSLPPQISACTQVAAEPDAPGLAAAVAAAQNTEHGRERGAAHPGALALDLSIACDEPHAMMEVTREQCESLHQQPLIPLAAAEEAEPSAGVAGGGSGSDVPWGHGALAEAVGLLTAGSLAASTGPLTPGAPHLPPGLHSKQERLPQQPPAVLEGAAAAAGHPVAAMTAVTDGFRPILKAEASAWAPRSHKRREHPPQDPLTEVPGGAAAAAAAGDLAAVGAAAPVPAHKPHRKNKGPPGQLTALLQTAGEELRGAPAATGLPAGGSPSAATVACAPNHKPHNKRGRLSRPLVPARPLTATATGEASGTRRVAPERAGAAPLQPPRQDLINRAPGSYSAPLLAPAHLAAAQGSGLIDGDDSQATAATAIMEDSSKPHRTRKRPLRYALGDHMTSQATAAENGSRPAPVSRQGSGPGQPETGALVPVRQVPAPAACGATLAHAASPAAPSAPTTAAVDGGSSRKPQTSQAGAPRSDEQPAGGEAWECPKGSHTACTLALHPTDAAPGSQAAGTARVDMAGPGGGAAATVLQGATFGSSAGGGGGHNTAARHEGAGGGMASPVAAGATGWVDEGLTRAQPPARRWAQSCHKSLMLLPPAMAGDAGNGGGPVSDAGGATSTGGPMAAGMLQALGRTHHRSRRASKQSGPSRQGPPPDMTPVSGSDGGDAAGASATATVAAGDAPLLLAKCAQLSLHGSVPTAPADSVAEQRIKARSHKKGFGIKAMAAAAAAAVAEATAAAAVAASAEAAAAEAAAAAEVAAAAEATAAADVLGGGCRPGAVLKRASRQAPADQNGVHIGGMTPHDAPANEEGQERLSKCPRVTLAPTRFADAAPAPRKPGRKPGQTLPLGVAMTPAGRPATAPVAAHKEATAKAGRQLITAMATRKPAAALATVAATAAAKAAAARAAATVAATAAAAAAAAAAATAAAPTSAKRAMERAAGADTLLHKTSTPLASKPRIKAGSKSVGKVSSSSISKPPSKRVVEPQGRAAGRLSRQVAGKQASKAANCAVGKAATVRLTARPASKPSKSGPTGRRKVAKGKLPEARRSHQKRAHDGSVRCALAAAAAGSDAPRANCLADFRRLVARVRHQISRIKQEQHLIDVYSADAARSASAQKVRLTLEVERAQQAVARAQEVVRRCVRFCDELPGARPIPAEHLNKDGEVDEAHIFCSVCEAFESTDGNDIILCDGPCNFAYHEQCMEPALKAAELPEDDAWLCPACDAKADILIAIHEGLELDYDISTSWRDVLAGAMRQQRQTPAGNPAGLSGFVTDAAAAPLLGQARRPTRQASRAGGGAAPGPIVAGGILAVDLPSDEDDDHDFDMPATNDSWDRRSAHADGSSEEGRSGESVCSESDIDLPRDDHVPADARAGATNNEDPADLVLIGKRRRTAVNYVQLHIEMFGAVPSSVAATVNSDAADAATVNGHDEVAGIGHERGGESDDGEYHPGITSPHSERDALAHVHMQARRG